MNFQIAPGFNTKCIEVMWQCKMLFYEIKFVENWYAHLSIDNIIEVLKQRCMWSIYRWDLTKY